MGVEKMMLYKMSLKSLYKRMLYKIENEDDELRREIVRRSDRSCFPTRGNPALQHDFHSVDTT